MAIAKKDFLTVEEYFELEDNSEEKYQYFKGEVFMMAGGTANHNRIAGNLFANLRELFKGKPCEAFTSDMKIQIEASDLFTYPDVSVVCGEIDFYENRQDTISNPKIVFEVLSESTKDYDRGTKFLLYRSLESLTDYVLVSQSEVRIEHFHKNDKGIWSLKEIVSLEEIFSLSSPSCEISVKEIYERVDFSLLEKQ